MDSKKSNIIYISFLCFTIPMIMIFIIVPVVQASKAKKSFNVDYNTTLELGDYLIKISDAAYITDKQELDFMLSIKENNVEITASYPEVTLLHIEYDENNSDDKSNDYQIKELNDLSKIISTSDVEENIKYVEIIVESSEPDYYDEDRIDEFGDVIKGKKHKGERFGQRIIIDNKDITHVKSSEYNPHGKKIIEEDENNSGSDPSISDSSESTNTSEYRPSLHTTLTPDDYDKWLEDQRKNDKKKSESSSESSSSENPSDTSSANNQDCFNSDNHSQSNDNFENNYDNNDEYEYDDPADEPELSQQPQQQPTQTTQHIIHTTTTTTQGPVYVIGIKLSTGFPDNNVKLFVGDNHQISAVITPSNADNKSVMWSSNRAGVAIVDSNGTITAVEKGKAIITATTVDGALTASCMVTVS